MPEKIPLNVYLAKYKKGGLRPSTTRRDEMNIEYKVVDNGNFEIDGVSYPDWRVEQYIAGTFENSFDGGWTKAYAKKTKKYLERSAGL
tara:strand:+ start:1131 stop:1394 length:264 start_codon:yes stop_codon:yes gene_type:complete